jgi:site-specific recombinase XerD
MMLEKFLKTIELKGRSPNTVIVLNKSVVKAQAWVGKPLEDATFEEIQSFIEYIKENGLRQDDDGKFVSGSSDGLCKGSLWTITNKIIQFYTYCFNETDDPKYLKMVRRIKTIRVDTPKTTIQAKDILSPEDIKKLINVATIERDRCIVASLYEPGMRLGEFLALDNDMVIMNEASQSIIFNIPDTEDSEDGDPRSKTGARAVECLEIYGYVQDWMKCNTSTKFMPLSESGVRKVLQKLFRRAGINKPDNPHNLRHSSITNACIINMQPNKISMRYWGIPNSLMLARYIHLSDQIVNSGYRDAKGMGNGNGTTIINPIAFKCVECGKLIQSGNLCKTCEDTKNLKDENLKMKEQIEFLQKAMEEVTSNIGTILIGNEITKNIKKK